MKRSAKRLTPQMNLALLEAPAAVSGDQQKELLLTLMEILINAACQSELRPPAQGGQNQPAEAHR